MGTQWRVGMCGETGLDYPTLFAILDRLDLSKADWWAMFNDIRLLENEALKAMRKS